MGPPRWEGGLVSESPWHSDREPGKHQGSVSADSNFQKRLLCGLRWVVVVALIQGLHDASKGPAGFFPNSAITGQARLFTGLLMSKCEQPLSGPLGKLLGDLGGPSSRGEHGLLRHES